MNTNIKYSDIYIIMQYTNKYIYRSYKIEKYKFIKFINKILNMENM